MNTQNNMATPDALRFAPLRIIGNPVDGTFDICTKQDNAPGSLNNFTVASCQNYNDAAFFKAAPDMFIALEAIVAALTQPVQFSQSLGVNSAQVLRGDARLAVQMALAAIEKATTP